MLKNIRTKFASYLIRLGLRLLPYHCEHVTRELEILQDNILIPNVDKISRLVHTHLKLHTIFGNQRDDNAIVGYFIFRLLNGYPLSVLTGFDDEWEEIQTRRGPFLRNKRCRSIIHSPSTHTTWETRARLFEQYDGSLKQTFRSSKIIDFPYSVPDHPTIIKKDLTVN